MNQYLEEAVTNLKEKGFLDIPISPEINLIKEIEALKKKKNAIILCHYYQTKDIQEVADRLGDSLYLSQTAAKVSADMIVFAGVHFMAETAKILNPNKKVVLPDSLAGCSLAESCPPDKFKALRDKYPNAVAVSYINCSSNIKMLSDIICTSSNAEKIINSIPKSKQIIFAPDKNLGKYLIKKTGRDMIIWEGTCIVHEALSLEKITNLMLNHPNAKLIAHPESTPQILNVASFIGSTSALLKYVQTDRSLKYIIATEEGILHEMRKRAPGKTFIPAPVEDETCSCSECFYMKLNTLQKIYLCMKYEQPEITLDADIIEKALIPINRMLEIS